MITAATLGMSRIVAGYIDQTSEEMVAAYGRERENWLRNRSAARAARIRDLLSGERIDVSVTEATLGYRLRQCHVGLVCWAGDATAAVDNITRLEHAISHVAGKAACSSDPVFLPRDESSAWAWLPLGIRDTFDAAGARTAGADGDIHFAFGDAVKGVSGFRLTHRQAIAAQAVALAAGSPPPRVVTFSEVAPVAMMLGSADLLRAWVLATLGGLATDDEHHARLRDTLLLFLQSGGSYKATAEQMVLHKNGAVPDPQGRGELGPARRREPPRRGTRAAGRPLARRGRAAAGPGTTSTPDGRPLGRAARAATAAWSERCRPPLWSDGCFSCRVIATGREGSGCAARFCARRQRGLSARPCLTAPTMTLMASPRMIKSVIICPVTTSRAVSVLAAMSPNPTVENTVPGVLLVLRRPQALAAVRI
jgi:GGDEF-like domain